MPEPTYHIVDCGGADCRLCPQVYRHDSEAVAIDTAKAHREAGEVEVLDVSED